MNSFEQMVRQQGILARFGDFALESTDLDAVLTEACRLIGEAFDTNLAKILEIEAAEQTLLVRAGIGWDPGVVGVVRLPMGEHSSESYAIRQGEPVITTDIRREDRFDFPAFMTKAGVIGVVNVPIFLPGRRAYGLLEVDSCRPWDPSESDTEYLRTYAAVLGPVIDRLHKIHALKLANDRNETLLHELQHRIKNNIGAVTSLVRMRMGGTQSPEVRSELGVIGERVEALRLVHEHVYATKNADRLALRPYVTQLIEGLLRLHSEAGVRLDARIDDVEIRSDVAIPLGLILNEFTTNSVKYAFDGQDAVSPALVMLEARQRDGRLRIRISDNGKGLPQHRQNARPGSGTGMGLIDGLSRQIAATPEWESGRGTTLQLEFPNPQ